MRDRKDEARNKENKAGENKSSCRSVFQSNRDYDLFSGRLTHPRIIIKAAFEEALEQQPERMITRCCEQSNDREKIAAYFRSNSSVHALFPGTATFQINQICSGMHEAAGTGSQEGENRPVVGRRRAKSPRRSFRTELSAPRTLEPGNAIMSRVINSPLQLHSPFPPTPSPSSRDRRIVIVARRPTCLKSQRCRLFVNNSNLDIAVPSMKIEPPNSQRINQNTR